MLLGPNEDSETAQQGKSVDDEPLLPRPKAPVKRCGDVFFTRYEQQQLGLYLQACAGMYGGMFFWVGAWDLIDDSRKNGGLATPDTPWIFPADDDVAFYGKDLPFREYLFTAVGLFLIVCTDTVYANAGMDGNYFRGQETHSCIRSTARLIVGMLGSLLLWDGLYDLHWRVWFTPSAGHMILSFIIGGIVLVLTGTFWAVAYIDPFEPIDADDKDIDGEGEENEEEPDALDHTSSFRKHAWQTLMALLSIIGQNAIWVAAFGLLEGRYPKNYPDQYANEDFSSVQSNPSVWRELFYIVIGMLCFVQTGSFVANSWIDVEELEEMLVDPDKMAKKRMTWGPFLNYGRGCIAIFGQVVHNTG
jgi:hypothetical protein